MNRTFSLGVARALAVAGFAFWAIYVIQYVFGIPLFLADEQGPSVSAQIVFLIYGYLTLLLGVFLGVVYKELRAAKQKGRSRVSIRIILRNAQGKPDFWIGIFASPVVYVMLLQAVELEDVSVAGVVGLTLVGLQNGFVCETIAESLFSGAGEAQAEVGQ